jgi:dTDP-L-rhamnose 4-epimerase
MLPVLLSVFTQSSRRLGHVAKQILITGGAGFIGSHLTSELLRRGHRVRILDSLIPQVHGPARQRPDYLDSYAELLVGDVRDAAMVKRALKGVEVVYHFAARVGVGQSMYEMAEYTSVNSFGTSVLLQELVQHPVEKLIVASSMSVYGEGLYKTRHGRVGTPIDRSLAQLRAGDWEVRSEQGDSLTPAPTPESKPPSLSSVYALGKFDQEQMCLMIGRAYSIPTIGLRFFNVYGPNQALSNPYTGVLAIFASRLLNGNPPLINEDGLQQRDFVSVYDVARACRLSMEMPIAGQQVFNVGGGQSITILDLAQRAANALGKSGLDPVVTGKYRVGDIRHCFADISRARQVLGYEPQVTLEAGLTDLAGWLDGQTARDRVMESRAELAERGLMV